MFVSTTQHDVGEAGRRSIRRATCKCNELRTASEHFDSDCTHSSIVSVLYKAESQKSKGATIGHCPEQFPVLMDCKSLVFTVYRVNRGRYCGVGRSYLIPGVFAILHAYDEETTCWCLWLGRQEICTPHPKADRVRVRVSAFRVVSESTGIFCDSFFCTLGILPLVSRNNSTIMTMPCPYGLSKLANLNESLLLGKHIVRNSGWRVESCVELRLFSPAAFFFSSYFFLPFSVQQYPQSRAVGLSGCGLRAAGFEPSLAPPLALNLTFHWRTKIWRRRVCFCFCSQRRPAFGYLASS